MLRRNAFTRFLIIEKTIFPPEKCQTISHTNYCHYWGLTSSNKNKNKVYKKKKNYLRISLSIHQTNNKLILNLKTRVMAF